MSSILFLIKKLVLGSKFFKKLAVYVTFRTGYHKKKNDLFDYLVFQLFQILIMMPRHDNLRVFFFFEKMII